MAVFQSCWDVIKANTMGCSMIFMLVVSLKTILMLLSLLLVRRTPGSSILKDFRPISLVSDVYKIIAKVLANRLRRVVSRVYKKSGAKVLPLSSNTPH